MSIQEFPKMVYRADGAKIVNRIVANAEELADAEKDGWGDRAIAREAAAKAPQPAPEAPAAKGDVNKKLALENLALVNQLASKDEMITAKDGVIQSQGDRIVELQSFVAAIGEDTNCPGELKAAIGALLGVDLVRAKRSGKK